MGTVQYMGIKGSKELSCGVVDSVVIYNIYGSVVDSGVYKVGVCSVGVDGGTGGVYSV